MGGKISVQLSPDESAEVAGKTGFSVAQVNKLYHRYKYIYESIHHALVNIQIMQYNHEILSLINNLLITN